MPMRTSTCEGQAHTYEMNGTYRFDRLAPGTSTLLVVIYPDEVDTMTDAMGQALVAAEAVRLGESQEEVVDLWPLPVQQNTCGHRSCWLIVRNPHAA